MRDLGSALRGLSRGPRFAALVIATLGLGVGVNTVVFSLVDAALFEPLPYSDPGRIVSVWSTLVEEDVPATRSSLGNVRDWVERGSVLAEAGVHDPFSTTLGGDLPERVTGVLASPEFFSVLDVAPSLGRVISARDVEERRRVVVLSDRTWRQRFGASRDVLEATVTLDGAEYRVIGVMPRDFGYLDRRPAFWAPHLSPTDPPGVTEQRGPGAWQVVARLRPGVGLQRAQAELAGIAVDLERRFPEHNRGLGIRVRAVRDELAGPGLRRSLFALWAAVGFVLLIACVNVAGLFLARGAARSRDLAIRAAVGAGRGDLIRLALAESLVLGTAGAVLGVVAAIWALSVLSTLQLPGLPRLGEAGLNLRVLGFAIALTGGTVVFVGLLPGFVLAGRGLQPVLTAGGRMGGGRAASKLRRSLVVAELALAMVTLTGAGLMTRSLAEVMGVDQGFDDEGVLYARLALPVGRSDAERVGFFDALFERALGFDGVSEVGAIDDFFVTNTPGNELTLEEAPRAIDPLRRFTVDDVTEGFFSALGVPLVRGRGFERSDHADAPPVVIVNESMANRLWPGRDPVGRRLRIGSFDADGPWSTVVGVVADFHRSGPEAGSVAQLFRPYRQAPSRSMTLVVRIERSDPAVVLGELRSAVAEAEPTVPVFAVSTLGEQLGLFSAGRRLNAALLAAFASMALILGAIGVYGLSVQSVRLRRREFGARMAVGATSRDIVLLVLGEGLRLGATGAALGVLGAVLLGYALRGLLFGVSPTDPVTLATVAVALTGTVLLSTGVPAVRASRVDPATVMSGDA